MEITGKLAYNILQLQNQIKRDPESYRAEFLAQYNHYQTLLELFKLNPEDYNENVDNLVMFLAQVSTCYKSDLEKFPADLMQLLRDYSTMLNSAMRLGFCRALILMNNRNFVTGTDLLKLWFELFRCNDKVLRKYLQTHVISNIKKVNMKHKNTKLNTELQNFMFQMLKDRSAIATKVSLDIMIDLYKKNIWKDAKTVNIIATACFSKINKVLVAALKFFLGIDKDGEEENSDSEESDNENAKTIKEVMQSNKVNKKSRKRMRVLQKTKQAVKKSHNKKKDNFDFSAIHLLHDPQGMAEKLLKNLESMTERFEIKLLMMNFISRLIGVHELILLNFYPLLIRYIQPRQREVTKVLLFSAQAAHEQVPPDEIGPVVRHIAQTFITERNSSEVITVGLNAIREICARAPFAIDQDLLQDLVQYQKYKDKNVQMGAKSLIQLFRQLNPKMLQRKFRSRPTEKTKELDPIEYGALKAKSYIPGTEVLPVEPSLEDLDQSGTVNDDAEDSDGSWINISHSEDDISDIEEEDEGEEGEDEKSEDKKEESNESSGKQEETDKPQEEAEDSVECSEKDAETTQEDPGPKQESNSTAKSTQESDREKAMTVSQSRILSQEDFRKLKVAQIAKEVRYAKGQKRKPEETTQRTEIVKNEIVSLGDIEKLHKKMKLDKEARLAKILEGKEPRSNFGKKKSRINKSETTGKTQKQNNRKKNWQMLKHKLRGKQKRSFKEKQVKLRDALLKSRRKR